MKKTKFFATLALIFLVGVAACDRSDADGAGSPGMMEQPMPPQEMDPETMQRIAEIQTIQQQLEPIQQEALQDEALAGRLIALQGQVEAAMREEDPEAVDRMERLVTEVNQAQVAGDEPRMQALMMEGQALQQELQVLQAAVLERPEIREPVEAFEAAHRARMVQIAPEADSLLDRMEALIASLPR